LPVGEDCEHPVDVRIIAATNRPLDQMIATGRFREDLHDRLNVFRIEIPPLRQRLDDIEVQACYFLELYQDEAAPGRTGFDDRAREALRSLPWPGNTRELENLVREILAHSDGRGEIGLDAFPTWVHARLAAVQPSPAQPAAWPEISVDSHVQKAWELKLSLNEAVAAYEKHLLQKTLEATEGNRTRAASLLGLTPRTVFNKIRKYQLDL
jgi:transcriptional regulator with PAS, ATPase and Fis domain